jgi:hypothetical protein
MLVLGCDGPIAGGDIAISQPETSEDSSISAIMKRRIMLSFQLKQCQAHEQNIAHQPVISSALPF